MPVRLGVAIGRGIAVRAMNIGTPSLSALRTYMSSCGMGIV